MNVFIALSSEGLVEHGDALGLTPGFWIIIINYYYFTLFQEPDQTDLTSLTHK